MKKLLPWAWAAALLSTLSAHADVKLNDNLTVSGYIAGAYTTYSPDPGTSSDSLFDASKAPPGAGDANAVDLTFTASYQPVTAVVSLFDFPGSALGLNVLDAYVTYDAGGGVTVTGGKFLSYLGYESFYPTLMTQISYANGDFLGAIPGYHSGVKLDYTAGSTGMGFAVLDSVYSPYGYNRGDGELKHNAGFEGYVVQKIGDVTLWGGFGYDTKGNFQVHSVLTLDVWLSYQLNQATSVGAEYQHKDGGLGAKGYNWLAFLGYNFTDKVYSAFRISGEKLSDGGPGFLKYTVGPAYTLTDHLTVRAEVSYYDYENYTVDSATFFGVQALFKF
ncbi:MAG: outer membrane beta-barrel protein [Opitutaceae bacterium]|nr:outer membrane beta-barrel protein [Opitutaceae bacterium]